MVARMRPINLSSFVGPISAGIEMEGRASERMSDTILGVGRDIGTGIVRGRQEKESRRRADQQYGLEREAMDLRYQERDDRLREKDADRNALMDGLDATLSEAQNAVATGQAPGHDLVEGARDMSSALDAMMGRPQAASALWAERSALGTIKPAAAPRSPEELGERISDATFRKEKAEARLKELRGFEKSPMVTGEKRAQVVKARKDAETEYARALADEGRYQRQYAYSAEREKVQNRQAQERDENAEILRRRKAGGYDEYIRAVGRGSGIPDDEVEAAVRFFSTDPSADINKIVDPWRRQSNTREDNERADKALRLKQEQFAASKANMEAKLKLATTAEARRAVMQDFRIESAGRREVLRAEGKVQDAKDDALEMFTDDLIKSKNARHQVEVAYDVYTPDEALYILQKLPGLAEVHRSGLGRVFASAPVGPPIPQGPAAQAPTTPVASTAPAPAAAPATASAPASPVSSQGSGGGGAPADVRKAVAEEEARLQRPMNTDEMKAFLRARGFIK